MITVQSITTGVHVFNEILAQVHFTVGFQGHLILFPQYHGAKLEYIYLVTSRILTLIPCLME